MEDSLPETAPAPFTRRSRYILVVEGNNSELFYTAMLLQRFAYPVCTARTAGTALDMVSVAVPALVIADEVLPGRSGIEFLQILGSTPRTFSVPVILLMEGSEAGPRKRAFDGRPAFCLPKPTPMDDLYRAVQEAMEPHPRANIRIQTILPATINAVALDSAKGECVTHLSAHGMYVRTLKPFSRNEQLAVELELKGRVISADALVLYNRGFESSPFMEEGMALKFTRMRGEDRAVLMRFIHDEVTRGIIVVQEAPEGRNRETAAKM